jgi:pimeloyl-ACP methyl ester carboxylesterase
MELRRITLHGHRIAYRIAGDGPLVVLIHGMAGSSAAWRFVMPSLAGRFTVLAPDLLGHGASAKPRGDYSLSGHANVVHDLLTALGYEHATLVGQSFGGGVALQLAYQFPEHAARLALVSSGGLGREVSALLRGLAFPGAEHVFPTVCSTPLREAAKWTAGWLARVGVRATPAAEEAWRAYASLADADARHAFFRTLHAVIDPGGQAVSAADRLYLARHVPTLIVWGARDSLIPPSHAYAAHAAIPGSRLELFEDVGHFPHCEAPERFLDVLTSFIDSTAPARASADDRRMILQGQAASACG